MPLLKIMCVRNANMHILQLPYCLGCSSYRLVLELDTSFIKAGNIAEASLGANLIFSRSCHR